MRPGLPYVSRSLRLVVVTTLMALCGSSTSSAGDDERSPSHELREGIPARPAPFLHATLPAATISFGRFTSYQINVDAVGNNIVGDAANEPSIAVDANDHNRMAVGWRQFDTVTSTFREAGVGFTTNGGLNWTCGKLDPGVFRSDPVLSSDAQGRFYYVSATLNFTTFDITTALFVSTNQGQTWGPPIPAFGGDKEWMTVDRTGGVTDGFIYQSWSTGTSPSNSKNFARSVNQGQSFQNPLAIPHKVQWGTIDVGPDGTVYVAGMNLQRENQLARSMFANNSGLNISFDTRPADIGGIMVEGQAAAPNGFGLLGQTWIAVDRSAGPRAGWLYMLASVRTPTDPLDVMFIRSTDGGLTWSTPKRVNDDPVGNGAYQWFGTMSVAPNGRIDVVWNDTRGSADLTHSALYYSYSHDGGMTWSTSEQASPVWDSTINGFPFENQKIGDYYHMISDDGGADLAWAATFNGDQDVYYMRIPAPASAPMLASRSAVQPLGVVGSAPNPFTSSTAIQFDVPGEGGRASVNVFDMSGRRVAELFDGFAKGRQSVRWSGVDATGRPVRPGVYLCRVDAPGATQTLKLMLLK